MLVQVLLGLDVDVDSLADDGVGHIERSATGGVEVDGLAGGFLGALLRGRGVVSIAGDAPAGVVIGVGAVLGGVRDVLEACDGVREAGRGIQLLRFSRGKMQFAGTRKSHDAARAGEYPAVARAENIAWDQDTKDVGRVRGKSTRSHAT